MKICVKLKSKSIFLVRYAKESVTNNLSRKQKPTFENVNNIQNCSCLREQKLSTNFDAFLAILIHCGGMIV